MAANTSVSRVNIPTPNLTAFKEKRYIYIDIYIYSTTYVSPYKEKLKDNDKNFKQVAKKQNACLHWP